MRPYKDYQIAGDGIFYTEEYGVLHSIQLLYDEDTKETFKPSELPIWNSGYKPGYIVPSKMSAPYRDSNGSYYVAISVLTVFPHSSTPYKIHLPKEGWLFCKYEIAKECGWGLVEI